MSTTWKIVADSGCDLKTLPNLSENTSYERVPLMIQLEETIFVDEPNLDIRHMLDTIYSSPTAAKSACPSPEAFAKSYEGADNVFVITITGGLSGSQNSAQLAKNLYLENNPNANIHVIDSLSAGGEIDLIVLELNRLIGEGLSFDEVVSAITDYQARTKLLFVLAKVDNLVKNGRLSKLIGTVVGLLNIRMVGEASDKGTLELLQKPRGEKKAVLSAFDEMLKAGYRGGRVMIAHCYNPAICQKLTELIHGKFPNAPIQTIETSGLCSFYGEEGGILMGYEC